MAPAVISIHSVCAKSPPPIINLSNAITLGFEYWANPNNREEGFIAWQANGEESIRMGADAMTADPLPDGSGVDRRIVPEEPMVCFLI